MASINNTTDRNATIMMVRYQQPELSFIARWILYISYAAIFIIGVTGNSIVLYIIGIKYQIRRSFDVHIISLAIADLLGSFFTPITLIHDLITSLASWKILGSFGCKLFVSMNHLPLLVSAFMLITISVARLRAIQSATTMSTAIKRSIVEVLTVWLTAIAIVSPYAYVLNTDRGYCYDDWTIIYRFIYFAIIQCLVCFIPVIVMIIIYGISAVHLLNLKIPGNHWSQETRRKKRSKKIILMFGLIVFMFFILSTPYMVSFSILAYYGTFYPKLYVRNELMFFHLNYALYTVLSFNSCINPFIYAKMHHNVKQTFKRNITSTSKTFSHLQATSSCQHTQRFKVSTIFSPQRSRMQSN